MFRLAGLLLACEVVLTTVRLSRAPAMWAAYDATVWVLLTVRAGVAVLQFTAALMLFTRSDAGARFARAAWTASAILFVLEVGFRLAPSSIFPSHRWPIVGAYSAYALAMVVALHQSARRLR